MLNGDLQLVAVVIAAGAALLNIILVPLVKAAAKGEARQMFEAHNDDPLAHPPIAALLKGEATMAAQRATQAHDAALRVEVATQAFRAEVMGQLEKLATELRGRPAGHPAEINALREEVADLRVQVAALESRMGSKSWPGSAERRKKVSL